MRVRLFARRSSASSSADSDEEDDEEEEGDDEEVEADVDCAESIEADREFSTARPLRPAASNSFQPKEARGATRKRAVGSARARRSRGSATVG